MIFLMKVNLLLVDGNLYYRHFTFLESNFLTGRDLICQVMKSAYEALSNSIVQVSPLAMLSLRKAVQHIACSPL